MAETQQAVMEILQPRLRGERFEHGTVPLDVLRDLAVLEEMLVDVAKQKWRDAHPGRRRIPKGFVDGLEIRLTGIEEGSAILKLGLYLAATSSYLPTLHPVIEFVEQARSAIVAVVAAAEHGRPIQGHIDTSSLAYFDRLGRSLREGEALDLAIPGGESARLTRDTRHTLVLADAGVQEVSEEHRVRGRVPEADQHLNTFQLMLSDGRVVRAPLRPQYRATVLEALVGYDEGLKVLIRGVGRCDRQGQLRSLDEVEYIAVLDALDVEARLDEIAALRDGWFDGKGSGYSGAHLAWLAQMLQTHLLDPVPAPHLFPTPEGGVLAEWCYPPHDLSLEIDLGRRTGVLHALNLDTGDDSTHELSLATEPAWESLRQTLATLLGVTSD